MFGQKSGNIKASSDDVAGRPTSPTLGFAERAELVEYLLAIASIADRARRATVIEQLRAEIKTNISHHSVDNTHVFNMLNTCLQYAGGIQELREILEFFEGESIPMQQFKEALTRLSLTDNGQPKPSISLEDPLSILAAMPVKEDAPIPEVTTLPKGSRMPFAPYPYFVGRAPELRQLAMILKGEHGGAVIGQLVAATGLGGIGKTQLASEFVHRYGQYFAGRVFWLDFSSAGGIGNEVARCGGAGGMSLREGFDNLPLPDRVALVCRAWEEPLPRLLIFDNCEDEALVDEWRPKTGGCRVLITSRRGEWDVARAIEQVRLDTLTPAESERLLTHLAPRLTTEEKMAIAEALGHFPLALHLAGSFLKRYKRVGANRYLQEIEQKTLLHDSLEGRGSTYSPIFPVSRYPLKWIPGFNNIYTQLILAL